MRVLVAAVVLVHAHRLPVADGEPLAADNRVAERERHAGDHHAIVEDAVEDGALLQLELGEAVGAALDGDVPLADLFRRVRPQFAELGVVGEGQLAPTDGAVPDLVGPLDLLLRALQWGVEREHA